MTGFAEGLNNKLKVLTQRCDGMRNSGRLFQRLTTLDIDEYIGGSDLGALPLHLGLFTAILECDMKAV